MQSIFRRMRAPNRSTDPKRTLAALPGLVALLLLTGGMAGIAAPAKAQTESVLYSFISNPDGALPESGMIFDNQGSGKQLYGTTARGGASGYGVVYKLTPTSDGSVP